MTPPPSGLTATFIKSSPGPASLVWSAVDGATSYIVQKKLVGAPNFLTVATGVKQAAWTDIAPRAAAGTLYRVAATTAAGASSFSEPVTL
jgi:hypothetical protein